MKRKGIYLSFATVFVVVVIATMAYFYRGKNNTISLSADVPFYTVAELVIYDGTSSSSPILIGYEGAVYDVTAGRRYYEPGGEYHDLAGTDATAKLRYFGGSIIAQKYPIVGRLAP
jgi:predicted heme/steroid binding protein